MILSFGDASLVTTSPLSSYSFSFKDVGRGKALDDDPAESFSRTERLKLDWDQ